MVDEDKGILELAAKHGEKNEPIPFHYFPKDRPLVELHNPALVIGRFKILNQKGGLAYIHESPCNEVLNYFFGHDGWSIPHLNVQVHESLKEASAVMAIQVGEQVWSNAGSDNNPRGDLAKGAATDAFKRVLRMMGFGQALLKLDRFPNTGTEVGVNRALFALTKEWYGQS